MSSNFDQLLARVKQGERLSSAEVQKVRSALESRATDTDSYTLLHIIGKAGDQSLAPLVSRYLTAGGGDPIDDDGYGMLRRLAIQILGQWWKRRDAFDSVAEAAFADPSPHVRAIAASALGDLGAEHAQLRSRAANLILKGLDQYGKEHPEVWGAFYDGAQTLAGVEWSKRPLRPSELAPPQLDVRVLRKLHEYCDRQH